MKKKKRKNIYNLFHQYKINKTKLENKLKREKNGGVGWWRVCRN